MKQALAIVVSALLILASGCSSDSSGTSGNPFGGGGGGGGAVTWTITTQQGQQGTIFLGTPSTAATVTQVTVSLPAQQFNDVVQGDGTTVYPAGTAQSIGEYTGVAAGQQWTFRFQGKLGSANGAAYDVTSNFTVQ